MKNLSKNEMRNLLGGAQSGSTCSTTCKDGTVISITCTDGCISSNGQYVSCTTENKKKTCSDYKSLIDIANK